MVKLVILLLLIVLSLYTEYGSTIMEETFNNTYEPSELFDGLSYLHTILDKYGIKHWLCYGSLLGAVRENDIIKHDCDFDIGCFHTDREKIFALNNEIEKDGYKIVKGMAHCYDKLTGKTDTLWKSSFKFTKNGEILGDIFLYTLFSDGYIRRYDPSTELLFMPNYRIPYWFINELDTVKLRNMPFPAPRDYKVLLEYWYGKDWTVPVDTGRCVKGEVTPKNVHPDYDVYGDRNKYDPTTLAKYVLGKKINMPNTVGMPWKGIDSVRYVFMKPHFNWIAKNDNTINS